MNKYIFLIFSFYALSSCGKEKIEVERINEFSIFDDLLIYNERSEDEFGDLNSTTNLIITNLKTGLSKSLTFDEVPHILNYQNDTLYMILDKKSSLTIYMEGENRVNDTCYVVNLHKNKFYIYKSRHVYEKSSERYHYDAKSIYFKDDKITIITDDKSTFSMNIFNVNIVDYFIQGREYLSFVDYDSGKSYKFYFDEEEFLEVKKEISRYLNSADWRGSS